ncbi:hypothetical protein FRC09_007029 [Ceratobasidium sp. 395]|nr:hypothetical protein FRC09_007029 [Ceratobasidium sp. 395]
MSEAVNTANESSDTERLSSISQVLEHQHVLVACGDSFVGPLKLLDHRRVFVKRFSGASAKGLSNKKSLSQTGVQVTQLLDNQRPEQLLLVFGQVDLHILYLWKALKAQIDDSDPPSPRTYGATVLESYTTFLREDILPRARRENDNSGHLRNIFVASIIMPSVDDEHLDECVRKYQRREGEVTLFRDLRLVDCRAPTDIQTRRTMVQAVNMGLSTFCSGNDGVQFIDINKHITRAETGEVFPHVADIDPTTIHVRWEQTIKFWIAELARAGLVEADITADLETTARLYEAQKRARMERRRIAADATLSPTLSDTVSIDDPGSPLLLPRPMTGRTRGRSSTPPPVFRVRSTQTSPEIGQSRRGRNALDRVRGASSPPRGSNRSSFRFATVPGRSRAEDDDNWRLGPRRNSVPHVSSTMGLEGLFISHHSSPAHTPPPTPLLGEFAQLDEPSTQDEEATQPLEPSEEPS